MRLAVFSDVHSNLHALEAVLADAVSKGLDDILLAGDLVGYGAFPNETVSILRKRCKFAIYGNHDLAVIRINSAGMNPMAAAAVHWTAKIISAEAVDYLGTLKAHELLTIGGRKVGLYHGSPRDDEEYVYEADASADLLEMSGGEVLIMGHTHVPFIKELERGLVINAGSVGQPRDNDPRASYVILDTENVTASIVRVEYDAKAAAEAIYSAGLPSFLGTRLLSGI